MGFSPCQGVQISTLRLCLLRQQEEERNKVRRHTRKEGDRCRGDNGRQHKRIQNNSSTTENFLIPVFSHNGFLHNGCFVYWRYRSYLNKRRKMCRLQRA
jgi:hypothetical protein